MKKKIILIVLSICLLLGNLEFVNRAYNASVSAAGDFSFYEDIWSFSSDAILNGSEPYLTVELRNKLLNGRNSSEKERIENRLNTVCTDVSYGLAVLELLHYNGVWRASDIAHGAYSLHDVPAPVRADALTGLINYYDLLQYTDDIAALDENALSEGSSKAIINAENAVSDGGIAVMRLYKSSSSDAHTVLLCGLEKGSWNYQGTRYDSRILISDPSDNAFSQGSCLYYTSGGKWIIPDAGMSSQSGGLLGAVISDTAVLRKNGADPLKLPKLSVESVFVSPGETVIPITLYESCIPEAFGMSMDIDLSQEAAEILHLSFDEGSYELGGAVPMNLSSFIVNEPELIVSFFINSVTNGIICEDNDSVITFGMDCADEKTVRAAAEKYGLPLLYDDVYGGYYSFPIGFNTSDNCNYYSEMSEKTEYPILMTGEVCVVVEPKETTTITTATKTTTTKKATTTSTSSLTTITASATTSSSKTQTTTSSVTTETSKKTTASATTTTKPQTTTITKTTATTSKPKTTASSSGVKTTITSSSNTTFSTTKLTSATTKVTITTKESVTASSTTKLEFEWGKDNWNSPHDLLVPEYISDGYRLLDSHMANLTASMDPMEMARLEKILQNDWLGAEYGMAVTEILAKSGVFSVPVWDSSVKNIYELDLSDERNLSIISYYQLLQETNAIQQEIAWTSTLMSPKAVLGQLISMASDSSKGGNMTLACFFSSDYAHSAIAYGVEYGAWNIGGKGYDGRILLSDPYIDSFSNEHCLYFNSATLIWTIPSLDMNSSDSGTFIGLASNSVSLINDGGYFIDTDPDNVRHAFVPIIEIPAYADGFTVTPIDIASGDTIRSDDLKWFSTAASNIMYRRAGLQCDTEGFEILPAGSGEADYQLSFENCLLSLKASNVLGVKMYENCKIALDAYESDFEIGMTSKSELPWDNIFFSGKNANEITAEHLGSSIVLTGDSLKNITIKADSMVRIINESKLDFSKMLVYADDDGSIGISVDADGDGTCETVLSDNSAVQRYGDINLDGKISVLDVVYLGKYNAEIIKLNHSQLKNSDCVADGVINNSDEKALIDYIIEKISELPVYVE